MILQLPFSSDSAQTFTVQLGPNKYDMSAEYNDRSGAWYLSMTDTVTGVVMFQGSPLLLGVDLLAPYNFGIGSIIVVDTSGAGQDAGPDDLGARVVVHWISADEVTP